MIDYCAALIVILELLKCFSIDFFKAILLILEQPTVNTSVFNVVHKAL